MVGLDEAAIGLSTRFEVAISSKSDYDLGSWARAEGLDVTWDIVEYRAGDAMNNRWYFPGLTKYSSVKLARAATWDGTAKTRKWLEATSFHHELYTGVVKLLDSRGKPIHEWELRNVLPQKWSITGFNASQSGVAVETLELAHLGFLEPEGTNAYSSPTPKPA
ncbi:MAG TPA: phage tail protein [Acidimicrobiales bacterium]